MDSWKEARLMRLKRDNPNLTDKQLADACELKPNEVKTFLDAHKESAKVFDPTKKRRG